MPLQLTKPIIEDISKTHRKIHSYGIDVEKAILYLNYHDGKDDGEGGITRISENQMTVTTIGSSVPGLVADDARITFSWVENRINEIISSQEIIDVRAAHKQTFYEALMTITGAYGSITD
jgi:hypothetical protein